MPFYLSCPVLGEGREPPSSPSMKRSANQRGAIHASKCSYQDRGSFETRSYPHFASLAQWASRRVVSRHHVSIDTHNGEEEEGELRERLGRSALFSIYGVSVLRLNSQPLCLSRGPQRDHSVVLDNLKKKKAWTSGVGSSLGGRSRRFSLRVNYLLHCLFLVATLYNVYLRSYR